MWVLENAHIALDVTPDSGHRGGDSRRGAREDPALPGKPGVRTALRSRVMFSVWLVFNVNFF